MIQIILIILGIMVGIIFGGLVVLVMWFFAKKRPSQHSDILQNVRMLERTLWLNLLDIIVKK